MFCQQYIYCNEDKNILKVKNEDGRAITIFFQGYNAGNSYDLAKIYLFNINNRNFNNC